MTVLQIAFYVTYEIKKKILLIFDGECTFKEACRYKARQIEIIFVDHCEQ